jgi:ribose-phosphate pyrophosphokinase
MGSPVTIVLSGSCQNSGAIGLHLANLLNLPYAEVESHAFPDSEIYVRLPLDDNYFIKTNRGSISLQDSHIFYIQTTAPNQSQHLIELFLTLHKLNDEKLNISKVDLIVPYLAHSRQDKEFKPGEAISIDAIGQMLRCFNVNYLFTIDVHFNRRVGFYDRFLNENGTSVKGYNATAAEALLNYLKNTCNIKEAIVVIPDKGHKPIIDSIKKVYGNNIIKLSKERINEKEVRIKGEKINLEDKNIIIIDDMISTGRTIVVTIKWLKFMGAKNISVASTHFLHLDKVNARENIINSGVKNIVSTDSMENKDAKVHVAPIIAKAINTVYNNMYNGTNNIIYNNIHNKKDVLYNE